MSYIYNHDLLTCRSTSKNGGLCYQPLPSWFVCLQVCLIRCGSMLESKRATVGKLPVSSTASMQRADLVYNGLSLQGQFPVMPCTWPLFLVFCFLYWGQHFSQKVAFLFVLLKYFLSIHDSFSGVIWELKQA